MESKGSSIALFICVNLLFFSLTSGCFTCYNPNPNPNPTPEKGTCPRDALKLGICAKLLNGSIGATIGNPPDHPCCSALGGLLDLEAALIRKSLDDLPRSNYFTSWDFTLDPCNFAGVYCDGDKVIALNLGDPRAGSPSLTRRIDPAIGKLSALAELTIVLGRIIWSLSQTLSQLKNLRFLAVSRNFIISGDIPATLGELKGLQTLDLSFNHFFGSIPWSIGTPPALS
ncbi:Leucine rich repeat N-terminal domain-containing protein [Forsythia ovata]|uniref:Leucine rich repeat N-terminal domain-containing protein n=1 Tax=Forsythia ovata TaxID=205694 RepID=A0ABD1RNT6_9LAMI